MSESPYLYQILYATVIVSTLLVLAITRNQVKSVLFGAALAVVFMLSAGALHSALDDTPEPTSAPVVTPVPAPALGAASPQPK